MLNNENRHGDQKASRSPPYVCAVAWQQRNLVYVRFYNLGYIERPVRTSILKVLFKFQHLRVLACCLVMYVQLTWGTNNLICGSHSPDTLGHVFMIKDSSFAT